ncbi:vWA domain-containing protein [Actinospica robiniae]|uniref:vWA domain-containing protein n=1 Tax=Actinospica robiniae TaxID=304901 RepID=UPI0003FD3E0C|nr:VWA-like domain-containing protein [Actinospica robiniae]
MGGLSSPARPEALDPAAEIDMAKLLAARRTAVAAAPYLATALHALTIVPSYGVPTMAVDRYWRCYASPAFVAMTELPDLAVVWLHEVSHLVRDHHRRAERLMERSRNHKSAGTPALDPEHPLAARIRMNIAMDCEINDDLVESFGDETTVKLRLPKGAVTPMGLQIKNGALFEEYVRLLPKLVLNGDLAWVECGSGAHGGEAPWELDGSGAQAIGEFEAAAIRFRVREALLDKRRWGTVPQGWKRWAEGGAEPMQDWRALLGSTLRGCLAAGRGAGDYSYRRPSRRAASLDGSVVLPSLRSILPRVAVVVDTSGSVTDADLGSALAEVAAICRSVGAHGSQVGVYSCDAAVHTVQQICRAEELNLVGGGGTDMRKGIGRAAAARPRPDVIVVLTDGFTPWPADNPGGRVIAGIFGSDSRYSEDDDDDDYAPSLPPDWIETVRLCR